VVRVRQSRHHPFSFHISIFIIFLPLTYIHVIRQCSIYQTILLSDNMRHGPRAPPFCVEGHRPKLSLLNPPDPQSAVEFGATGWRSPRCGDSWPVSRKPGVPER
jgi:hypothetical protein